MTTEIIAGPLGEMRAASTAGGGTALTTTATFIQLPIKSDHIFITPRNFATAVVAQFALNPWLVVLKTIDGMASTPTDYSDAAQDADTATSVDISELGALTAGDFLLVGAALKFRGVYFDIDGTNGLGTAALQVDDWRAAGWNAMTTALGTLTDGTFSTRTFAQDGLVSWTPNAGWLAATLREIYPTAPNTPYSDMKLFWTRWTVSAAITDTSVTIDSMVAANRSTAYAELMSGQTFEERIRHGEIGGFGCVEALTDAGTANLIVNVATFPSGKYR